MTGLENLEAGGGEFYFNADGELFAADPVTNALTPVSELPAPTPSDGWETAHDTAPKILAAAITIHWAVMTPLNGIGAPVRGRRDALSGDPHRMGALPDCAARWAEIIDGLPNSHGDCMSGRRYQPPDQTGPPIPRDRRRDREGSCQLRGDRHGGTGITTAAYPGPRNIGTPDRSLTATRQRDATCQTNHRRDEAMIQ